MFSVPSKTRLTIDRNDACIIFVGTLETPFSLSNDALSKCKFLADRVASTAELRNQINLNEYTDISPNEFNPVRDFLDNGEFTPHLIESEESERLCQVITEDEKDTAAETIAKVYLTASKIQFAELQSLCVRKLRALYPLSAKYLLIVIRIVTRTDASGCEAEESAEEWLVDHVFEYFWHLVECEGMTFSRLMVDNDCLRQGVLAKLVESPKAGIAGLDID